MRKYRKKRTFLRITEKSKYQSSLSKLNMKEYLTINIY